MSYVRNKISRIATTHNKYLWITIFGSIGMITGLALVDEKWFYLGIFTVPLILYLSIEKPIIFPLGLYVFLLPFDSLLAITGSSKGATLTKLIGLMTIAVFLLKGAFENKLRKPDNAAFWWLLFIIYVFSSILWSIDEPSWGRISTAGGLLLLYLVVASYQIQKKEFDLLKKFIYIGGFIVSVFLIYAFISGVTYEGSRSVISIGERTTSPDAFAQLLPIAICVQLIIEQEKIKIKLLHISVLGTMLLGTIFTGSRSSSLGVAAIILVYMFYSRKRFAFAVILIILGFTLMSFIPDMFIERWGEAKETGGSGRTDIWYVGIMSLKKYWFTGAGLDNFPSAFDEFRDYAPGYIKPSRGAHNTYIMSLVEFGMVGFSLMIIAIIKHYKLLKTRINKNDMDSIMLKAAFWAILVFGFFGTVIWMKSFWLLWTMILLYKQSSRCLACNTSSMS